METASSIDLARPLHASRTSVPFDLSGGRQKRATPRKTSGLPTCCDAIDFRADKARDVIHMEPAGKRVPLRLSIWSPAPKMPGINRFNYVSHPFIGWYSVVIGGGFVVSGLMYLALFPAPVAFGCVAMILLVMRLLPCGNGRLLVKSTEIVRALRTSLPGIADVRHGGCMTALSPVQVR